MCHCCDIVFQMNDLLLKKLHFTLKTRVILTAALPCDSYIQYIWFLDKTKQLIFVFF